MITRGEVKNLRELSGERIQASVCLGASVERGSAVVQVETGSPAVREAMANLKRVIAEEALGLTAGIIKDHEKWVRDKARRQAREAKKVKAG